MLEDDAEEIHISEGECPDGRIHLADRPKVRIITAIGAGLEKVSLKSLPRLKEINFMGNRLHNLNALFNDLGTDELHEIDLMDNQVSDIRPLARFFGLRYLNLAGNKIESIDALSGFDPYSEPRLILEINQISDLRFLLRSDEERGPSQIKYLFLGGNPITDFSPLLEMREKWENLEEVGVDDSIPPGLKEKLEEAGVTVSVWGEEEDEDRPRD